MSSRAVAGAVWAAVAVLIAWHIAVIASVFAPIPLIGMTAEGRVVDEIAPGSPAEKAKLLVGDRYLLEDAATQAFMSGILDGEVRPGGIYHIVVSRGAAGHEVRIPLTVRPESHTIFRSYPVRAVVLIANAVAFMVCIALAGWLLARRPAVMTLALAAATLSFGVPQVFGVPYPLSLFVWAIAWIVFQHGLTGAIVIFALRFPDDRIAGGRGAAQTAAIAFLIVSEALVVAAAISGAIRKMPPDVAFGDYLAAFSYAQAAAVAIAALIVLVRFQSAEDNARGQLAWGASGMAIALVAYVLSLVLTPFSQSENWEAFGVVAFLGVPLCAAHALLRTRFVDPRFLWNRAAIFGIMLLLLGVVFKSLEWLADHLFPEMGTWVAAQLGHPTTAGSAQDARDAAHWLVIVATACLSFGLTAARSWMQRAIERVFFHDKVEARAFIRRMANALTYAQNDAVVEDALACKAPERMRLSSAAHFRAAGYGTYVRGPVSRGWSPRHAVKLDLDDALVRFLLTEKKSVKLSEIGWSRTDCPSDGNTPDVAVPVVLRGDVIAIELYGPHVDHFEIDFEEIETLSNLAEHAAWATEHINAERLRTALGLAQERLAANGLAVAPAPWPAS